MDENGANKINLTNNTASDSAPSISPDGTKIAFVSNRTGKSEVYVMDSNGNNVLQLTVNASETGNIYGLDWHPNGQKIVFDAKNSSKFSLYQINSDGTGLVTLLNDVWDTVLPRFSLDGNKIYMQRNKPYNGWTSDIYVCDADGTNLTALTATSTGSADYTSRPPGGELYSGGQVKVVYGRSLGSGTKQIYMMESDGSLPINLSNNNYVETQPATTNRGDDFFAFASPRAGDGVYNIWIMDSEGKNASQLTSDGGSSPDFWRP